MRIEKLNQTTKKNLLEDLLKRSPNSYEMYEEQVKAILDLSLIHIFPCFL